MTSEQLAGFEAAAGGISAAALLLAIAMIVMTFYTLWTVWLALALAPRLVGRAGGPLRLPVVAAAGHHRAAAGGLFRAAIGTLWGLSGAEIFTLSEDN